MKNFSLFFLFTLFGSLMMAQPTLSIWQITDPEAHEMNHHLGANYVACGSYSYSVVEDGENIYHFDLLNEGDQVLTIVNVILSPNSSPGFSIENTPVFALVQPGQEASFEIHYTKPDPYVPGKGFGISVVTDDPRQPLCSFVTTVGIRAEDNICVCNGDSIYTVNTLENPPYGPKSNEFYLHSGPCNMTETCPDSSEVCCFFAKGSLITDYCEVTCAIGFSSSYNLYKPGFCPCEKTDISDICIREVERMQLHCLDTVELELYDCEITQEMLALPMGFKYKWHVIGFGHIVGSDSSISVKIADWFLNDEVYVEVIDPDDPDACVEILSYILTAGRRRETGFLDRLDDGECANGKITLCYTENLPAFRDGAAGKRGESPVWFSNNPSVTLGDPYILGNQKCVDVTGLNAFDRLAYYCPDDEVCYTELAIYIQSPCNNFCPTRTRENIQFADEGEETSIDDPCNCADRQNIFNPDGSVLLFHDLLSIDVGISHANEMVTILDLNGQFLQMDGTSFGTINTVADANGYVYQDFWHAPGQQAIIEIQVSNLAYTYFTALCFDTCAVVPTLNDWAIIVLLLSMVITTVVYLRSSHFRKLS